MYEVYPVNVGAEHTAGLSVTCQSDRVESAERTSKHHHQEKCYLTQSTTCTADQLAVYTTQIYMKAADSICNLYVLKLLLVVD